MLFKKSEPRRWNPCLVIAIGTLTVIGAVTVTNVSKRLMEKMKYKMKSMWKRSDDCEMCASTDECL
ncbi:MAG: hypothetical protein IKC87_01200 [Clostridia bacterium]|nr:hypothetical protein [Clostridia bacterium]